MHVMKHLSLKTRNIIVTSTVCAIALVTGVGLGTYFGQEMFGAGPTFEDGDLMAYEDDSVKIFKKYEKGASLDSLEPYELVSIANSIYDETPNHYSKITGTVDAGLVIQTVDTIAGRSDSEYFLESISCSSIVSVAKRFYQTGDSIVEYNGTSIDKAQLSATWGDKIEFASGKEFELKWGKEVKRSSIYIISSKTVTSSSKTQDDKGNWIVDLTLDPNTSTLRYARQIVNMSGLKKLPVFHSLEIQYVMDSSLNLISRTINENYDVNKMGVHNSTGILKETYHVGGFKLPDIKTNCPYGGN